MTATETAPPVERCRTVRAAQTSFLVRAWEAEEATGTSVLLLHGVPETASCWRDVGPALASGRRVLAPDLPGLGGSTYTGPYDVASLVTQLVALLETESAGAAVDVVGHDWGGVLAMWLAATRPDLVRRLVVANAPLRDIPLLRALHVPLFSLPVAPELVFRLGGRRVVEAMLALAWKAPVALHPESRAEYVAAYTDPAKVSAMLGYYRAAARPRVVSLLTRREPAGPPQIVVARAMVLWGALDPVLPIGTGESVVRDLGADCVMVTVPGAGHFVIEEAPEIVLEVLTDFLADEPGGGSAAPPQLPAAERGPTQSPPAAVDVAEHPTAGAGT